MHKWTEMTFADNLLEHFYFLTWSGNTVVLVETHHSVHPTDEDGSFALSIYL